MPIVSPFLYCARAPVQWVYNLPSLGVIGLGLIMPYRPDSHTLRKPHRAIHGCRDERKRTDPALARAQGIWSSARWQHLRAWYLRRHPLCKDPFGTHRLAGVTTAASLVHHILGVASHPESAFIHSNLMALCQSCHALIEAPRRKGGGSNL